MIYVPRNHEMPFIAADNEGFIAAINRQCGNVPAQHRPFAEVWIKGFVDGQVALARAAREERRGAH